ncbi:MAG TPA: metallophosphoesterase [bacterium]|nr:metallophosphoesterase [bacterium]
MKINRREFIKDTVIVSSTVGLTSAFGSSADASFLGLGRKDNSPGNPKKANFRFVHMADQHVFDKRQGTEGYKVCIQSVRALRPKPNFVLMGGDMVFDGCYNTKEDYLRWLKQTREISDQLHCRWYPCMGNHDPFGLSPRRKCDPNDPDIGKQLIMTEFRWPSQKSYYSFDYEGWHFAVLDTTYQVDTESGASQEAKIGSEQMEWLGKDLGQAGDRPKIVVMHVAVFYIKPLADANPEAKAIAAGMMVSDCKDLRLLLERHQVKAVLQGHCHHIEGCLYNGVHYLTSASASGAWWSGDWVGGLPGYTLFHCKGTQMSWKHLSYPWEPRLEDADTLERERQATYDAEKVEQERQLTKERGLL